jgi:hypothetical protein
MTALSMRHAIAFVSIFLHLVMLTSRGIAQAVEVPLHVTIDDSVWEMHFGVGVAMHTCFHPVDTLNGHREELVPPASAPDVPFIVFRYSGFNDPPLVGCYNGYYSHTDYRLLVSTVQRDTFRLRLQAGPRFTGVMTWNPNEAAHFATATLRYVGNAGTVLEDMRTESSVDLSDLFASADPASMTIYTASPAPTAVSQAVALHNPETPQLDQNFPNPLNPSTTIHYQLASRTRVTLSVFDLFGREVATLVDGIEEPGEKRATFDGSALASGVYFYRLRAGDFVQTRKLVLVR